MIKLSIITPVYNTQDYLKACLNSLINQDLSADEYEIIVVNDGSKDASKTIILEFLKSYKNIVFIDQENQGVSVARNKGIEKAKGEYLLFIDSDDALQPNILQDTYQHAKQNNIDLLYLKVEHYNEKNEYLGFFKHNKDEIEISDGFTHQRMGQIFGLYKRKILKNIRFKKGIPIAEDALFNIMVHGVAKRVSYYDKPAYKYYIREGSALQSKLRHSDRAFLGYIKMINEIKLYSQQNNFNEQQIKYFDRPFYKTIEMAMDNCIVPNNSVEQLKVLKNAIAENDLNHLYQQVSNKYRFFNKHWVLFILYNGIKNNYYKILGFLSKIKKQLNKKNE